MGLTARLVLLAAAFWPVWRWWGERIAGDPDAAAALVALLPAGLLLAREVAARRQIEPRGVSPMQPALVTLALLAIYVALFTRLAPLARALLAVSTLLVECRPLVASRTVFASIAGLVLLSLPALASSQFFLGYPLRILVGAGAAWLLRIYGFAVARDGVLLSWGEETFAVDAPCSGVRMLWAGAVLVFFLVGNARLGFRRAALLATGAGIAVLGANVVRVMLFFLAARASIGLDGWRHDAAGAMIFCFAIAAIVAAGMRLRRTVPCEA
jgi:exosortase/archaeosortase family protein